jgi:hypothetical protein
MFAASRVDQTAGRAIYQWDDLNQREQLIYGDTGWRSIALDPTYGVAAAGNYFGGANGAAVDASSIRIRRIGNIVHLSNTTALQPKQDYSTASRPIFVTPPGFRADGGQYIVGKYGNNGGDAAQKLVFITPGADYANPSLTLAVPMLDLNWNGYATGGSWPRHYGGIWVTGTWVTNDPWPTSLPGIASGTIPNI